MAYSIAPIPLKDVAKRMVLSGNANSRSTHDLPLKSMFSEAFCMSVVLVILIVHSFIIPNIHLKALAIPRTFMMLVLFHSKQTTKLLHLHLSAHHSGSNYCGILRKIKRIHLTCLLVGKTLKVLYLGLA